LLARSLSARLLLPAVLIGTLSALLLSALLIAILLHREISFEVLIGAARRGGQGLCHGKMNAN
jgi:hypothetical protein